MHRKIILLSACALLLFSCQEEQSIKSGTPDIVSVSSTDTYCGDTVDIYGKDLGVRPENSYIEFPSGLRISSKDVRVWNNSLVSAGVPKGATDGFAVLCVNGIRIDSVQLKIAPRPPFITKEIAAGKFMMGSNTGFSDELPVREVTVTRGFLAMETELTQDLWSFVMQYNNSSGLNNSMPADNMTWEEAVEFCNALSVIDGLNKCYSVSGGNVVWNSQANGWRLPTEAEWEYMCRAGSDKDFGGSGEVDLLGWYSSNSGINLHPVKEKQANAWGLYDVHGNVWEWCWDWYSEDYYSLGDNTDPDGPGQGARKVLRGGAFNSGVIYTRASNRTFSQAGTEGTGVRIVRNNF